MKSTMGHLWRLVWKIACQMGVGVAGVAVMKRNMAQT